MDHNLVETEIESTLEVVMLKEFGNKRVSELSGGMKRKLSLAMAIVTKPQVLIFDEPTSGLDVESRHQIWKLIKSLKKDRSIIMSSQHLEEADRLADRICIMTQGYLLTLDTPQKIKKKYGVGYKLLIEPKIDFISHDDFMEKKNELDIMILSGQRGIKEN